MSARLFGIAFECLIMQKRAEVSCAARERCASRVSLQQGSARELFMPFTDTARDDGTVEECLDELNDFMAGLQRY